MMAEILSPPSSGTARSYLSSLYEAPREKWRSFVTGRGMFANRGNFVTASVTTVTFRYGRRRRRRGGGLLRANKVISLEFGHFVCIEETQTRHNAASPKRFDATRALFARQFYLARKVRVRRRARDGEETDCVETLVGMDSWPKGRRQLRDDCRSHLATHGRC